MKYELAKQLKYAGFPQERGSGEFSDYDDKENVYAPTLSELIEACPKAIEDKGNTTNRSAEFRLSFNGWNVTWCACYEYYDETVEYLSVGKTPEEAVVKLWLELNKK